MPRKKVHYQEPLSDTLQCTIFVSKNFSNKSVKNENGSTFWNYLNHNLMLLNYVFLVTSYLRVRDGLLTFQTNEFLVFWQNTKKI